MTQTLLEWCRDEANHPSEDLLFKTAMWTQVFAMRDTVPRLFGAGDEPVMHVAGLHRSKSVTLPVYTLEGPWGRFFARGNFYNWNLSMEITKPVGAWADQPSFNRNYDYVFCEGMQDKKHPPLVESDRKKFTLYLGDHYDVYHYLALFAEEALAP